MTPILDLSAPYVILDLLVLAKEQKRLPASNSLRSEPLYNCLWSSIENADLL